MTATKTPTEHHEKLKQKVLVAVDELPPEALAAVADFVDFQRYKLDHQPRNPPYHPVKLGGLWKGIKITEEDIKEARREMWESLGERDW